MTWRRVPEAAQRIHVSPKVVYRAIRDGHCLAARIGSGRNVLVSDEHVDEWLLRSAEPAAVREIRPRATA
jgi:excisionase family DNA binding protein